MRALALVGVLLVAACGGGSGAAGQQLQGRTFLSSAVAENGADKPLVDGTRIQATFDGDELKVHAGCNHLFGRVTVSSGKLTVADMSSTGIGCDQALHQQDTWLSQFLSSGPAWRLDGDDLVLTGGTTEIRLTDRKVANPDKPLNSTRWVVDSIIEGDAVSSSPQGAHLVFSDGKVDGETGCNRLTGTAKQSGDQITFSQVSTTKIECPEDLRPLENAVIAALDGAVTYKIEAGALTLTKPDGKGIKLRAE